MFNEENTIEQMDLDILSVRVTSKMFAKEHACYGGEYNRNQGDVLHGI